MNETSSETKPVRLPSSRAAQEPPAEESTDSIDEAIWEEPGDWRLIPRRLLWNGEGPRCPVYWPFPDLESPNRCELVAEHRGKHFRSLSSV